VTKNVTKALLLLLLISAIVVAVSGCTTTPTVSPTPVPSAAPAANFTTLTAGTLSIATDASYAPFENVNTTSNQIEGFDIDLMNEIAKELKLNVTYTNQAFDGIILAVQTKKFDGSISAFTITAERQKTIDFTNPYYENRGQALAVQAGKDNIKTLADLGNISVGVQSGTVAQTEIANITVDNKTVVKTENIKAYTLMPDVMQALKKGEVQVAAGDYAVMKPYVDKYPGDYQFSNTSLSGVEYFGIVVNKDNSGLTAAINGALAKIKADGRYDTIYKKWFG
jgi:ABC-type amino acid transport substrate-binding protein